MARLLEAADPGTEVQLVPIRTAGDEGGPTPTAPPEDKSRFTREIEWALLRGEADLAVHSAKDVPGDLPDGLALVGVPERLDARDALCGAASLDLLREGAVVGTSSLRRRSQLLARREDLRVTELRGNVDTRLRRLAEGRFDAIVLAAAGLERLEREAGSAPLPADLMTPAPGQGALFLQGRAGDARTAELGARITHPASHARLLAERALVEVLGATCHTPVAAYAQAAPDGELTLSAYVGLPDGASWARDRLAGDAADPEALGRTVGERLLAAGAQDLLAAAEAQG